MTIYSVTEPLADYSGYSVHYWACIDGIYYGKLRDLSEKTIAKVREYIASGMIRGLIGIPYDSSKIKQLH